MAIFELSFVIRYRVLVIKIEEKYSVSMFLPRVAVGCKIQIFQGTGSTLIAILTPSLHPLRFHPPFATPDLQCIKIPMWIFRCCE
jgi:hypothetical protein